MKYKGGVSGFDPTLLFAQRCLKIDKLIMQELQSQEIQTLVQQKRELTQQDWH